MGTCGIESFADENDTENENEKVNEPTLGLIDLTAGGTLAGNSSGATAGELRYACAFSFPAVALALGRSNWPLLSRTYHALTRDDNQDVRKTLAASLHKIAELLGGEGTESELLPTFEYYLRDVEDVKIGIVANLARFLRVVPAGSVRESYLPALPSLVSSGNPLNWRIRQTLGSVVPRLVWLFDVGGVNSFLLPMVYEMIEDGVSEVRSVGVKGVVGIVGRFARELEGLVKKGDVANCQAMLDGVIERILAMGRSDTFGDRSSFLGICHVLATRGGFEVEVEVEVKEKGEEDGEGEGEGEGEEKGERERRGNSNGNSNLLLGLLESSNLLVLALEKCYDEVSNIRVLLSQFLEALPERLRKRPDVALAIQELENDEIVQVTLGKVAFTLGEHELLGMLGEVEVTEEQEI